MHDPELPGPNSNFIKPKKDGEEAVLIDEDDDRLYQEDHGDDEDDVRLHFSMKDCRIYSDKNIIFKITNPNEYV